MYQRRFQTNWSSKCWFHWNRCHTTYHSDTETHKPDTESLPFCKTKRTPIGIQRSGTHRSSIVFNVNRSKHSNENSICNERTNQKSKEEKSLKHWNITKLNHVKQLNHIVLVSIQMVNFRLDIECNKKIHKLSGSTRTLHTSTNQKSNYLQLQHLNEVKLRIRFCVEAINLLFFFFASCESLLDSTVEKPLPQIWLFYCECDFILLFWYKRWQLPSMCQRYVSAVNQISTLQ